jgi:hypothetical protein
MPIRGTQPQPVGGVLDTTFRLCKASVRKVLPLSLLMVLVSSPGSIYVFEQGGTDPSDLFAILRVMASPGYLLASLASCVGMMFILAAASIKMAAIAEDGDVSTPTALYEALRRLPSLVVSLALYLVVVSVGPILLFAPTYLAHSSSIAVMFGVALTLAAIIPGVSLLLFLCTGVFEKRGPIQALLASHRLVWGHWWRTNAVLAVGVIVLLVIYLVISVLIGIVTAVLVFGGEAADVATLGVVSDLLIAVLASPLITPYCAALFLALYWDLKLRRAGDPLVAARN